MRKWRDGLRFWKFAAAFGNPVVIRPIGREPRRLMGCLDESGITGSFQESTGETDCIKETLHARVGILHRV